MKLENTMYSNYKIVVDEFDIPIGVMINGETRYSLYDKVYVKADCIGYIGDGIKHEGTGAIVRIARDNTDYFFGVLMDNGEYGFVKDSRLSLVKL